jgi:hypothetical protein
MQSRVDNSRSPFDVAGKVVVITGAAGGIGQALCKAFRALGASVVGADCRRPAATGRRRPCCSISATDSPSSIWRVPVAIHLPIVVMIVEFERPVIRYARYEGYADWRRRASCIGDGPDEGYQIYWT